MKTDTYTKVVPTIIAFMLTLIACKTIINPEKTASAEGPFAGVQFDGSHEYTFFDAHTGEIWVYNFETAGPRLLARLWAKYKLNKLGEPLVVEFHAKYAPNK